MLFKTSDKNVVFEFGACRLWNYTVRIPEIRDPGRIKRDQRQKSEKNVMIIYNGNMLERIFITYSEKDVALTVWCS